MGELIFRKALKVLKKNRKLVENVYIYKKMPNWNPINNFKLEKTKAKWLKLFQILMRDALSQWKTKKKVSNYFHMSQFFMF